MQLQQLEYGQRIRVNLPGFGDHGQIGTIKKVHNGRCYVHLDWDARGQHLVLFYPEDLEVVSGDRIVAGSKNEGALSYA